MRLAASLAAASLLGSALSGCGGNPEPSPMPAPSSSTTPSASATPTPPVMPAAARKKTKQGAIAYAKSFIQTLNYAGKSGDTAPLREMYIPLCTRCEAIADGIDKTYRKGGIFGAGIGVPTQFKFYGIENDVAVL